MPRTCHSHLHTDWICKYGLHFWWVRPKKHVAVFGKLELRRAVAARKHAIVRHRLRREPRSTSGSTDSLQSALSCYSRTPSKRTNLLVWNAASRQLGKPVGH